MSIINRICVTIVFTFFIHLLFASVSHASPESSNVTSAEVEKKRQAYEKTKKQIEALQKKIYATDQQLSKTFEELERLNDRQIQTQKKLNHVLVQAYTSGHYNTESQLLNSKSVAEFLFRLELLKLTVERQQKLLHKYKKQKEIIAQKKKNLQKTLTELQPLLKQSEQKSKQLQQQYQSLSAKLKKLEQKKQQEQSDQKSLQQQNSTSIAIEEPTVINQSWLNKARAMIGTVKYVFGASSYPYFDCSSWTQYVFRKYRNIELPRTAAAQSKVGIFIPKNQLQPGDLVFFQGTYKAGVSHVGIYLGNGQFISNKNSRLHLQIESINSSYSKKHYWGAKRVNR